MQSAAPDAPAAPDGESTQRLDWRDAIVAFRHPRVIAMLFLGFSAGLPLLLIFSSLSLWLREAGVERSVVTLFSWAALGYSFKFVWAPLVDALRLPLLSRLGRRRGWLLLSQSLVIAAIIAIALQDPLSSARALTYMAAFAVLLGFASATQDIVIDAYRIESAPPRLQALLSATYIGGYRIGMLVAGAGALFLASYYGSTLDAYHYAAWRSTYLWMAAAMGIGVIATLVIAEPQAAESDFAVRPLLDDLQLLRLFAFSAIAFVLAYMLTADAAAGAKAWLAEVNGNRALAGVAIEAARLCAALASGALIALALIRIGWVNAAVATRSYVQPVRDFFARHGTATAWLLLGLIGLYRISDIVLGVIANVFYQDLGFSKVEIATVAKTYGLFMSLAGGFLGGALAFRYGVMRILFVGALLSAATNLLFLALAAVGRDVAMLYWVISADNLSAGLASAAFVAFLSALTNVKFTAVQFAIFTSLMTLLPKMLGGYSGAMVDAIGYGSFFLFTAALGVPVLALIWIARRKLQLHDSAL